MGPDKTFRSATSRYLFIAATVVAAISLSGLFLGSGPTGFLRYGGLPLLIAAAAWALFYRPCLTVGDGGIMIVNPLRTIRLSWPSITGFDTRWGLAVASAYGTYAAWAVPAPSRPLTRPARRTGGEAAADRGGRDKSAGAREALDRWEALKSAGFLDNPRLESTATGKSWNADVILVLVALIVWSVLGLAVAS